MTLIIGLSGKKESGKNSVFFMLKVLLDAENEGYVDKVSFADKLKSIAKSLGWNGVKDDKGRRLLQLLGTEVLRECIDYEYHVKRTAETLEKMKVRKEGVCQICERPLVPPRVIVISDVRFLNEIDFLRKVGGEVWRVRRPDHEAQQTIDKSAQHASETVLDGYNDWDQILVANNYEELLQEVKKQVERLRKEGKL